MNSYHSPYEMSFSGFIESTASPRELALVFHGHYERSGDTIEMINDRADSAEKWYEYFISR